MVPTVRCKGLVYLSWALTIGLSAVEQCRTEDSRFIGVCEILEWAIADWVPRIIWGAAGIYSISGLSSSAGSYVHVCLLSEIEKYVSGPRRP